MSGGRGSRDRRLEVVAPSNVSVPALPTVDNLPDPTMASHPAHVLPELMHLSRTRQRWLAGLLTEQIEAEGMSGLVGLVHVADGDGKVVEAREELRVLAQAESAERDRLANLAERLTRLGLDSSQLERDAARWATAALRAFVDGLGLTLADDAVRAVAKRSAIAGRSAGGGHVDRPDAIAPAPDPVRVAAALRAAADRLEAEEAREADNRAWIANYKG